MANVVVDTDVVSFLFKNDSRAQIYRQHLVGNLLIITFMTVAELDRWALTRSWGAARRSAMERHLRNFVVSPYTRTLCLAWAEVTYQRERRGRPISTADAWQAATALLHRIPLRTHNAQDFLDIDGLTVISESAVR